MTQIAIKRVYEAYSENDGYRVLVDRLWPRGMKKEYLKFDNWAKEITPSSQLRMWFHGDVKGRWSEFTTLYEQELRRSTAMADFLEMIRAYQVVTLLYASKEPVYNHAQILQHYMEKHIQA